MSNYDYESKLFLSLKSASGAILKEGSIDGMLTKTREVLPHRPGDGGGVGVVDVLQLANHKSVL